MKNGNLSIGAIKNLVAYDVEGNPVFNFSHLQDISIEISKSYDTCSICNVNFSALCGDSFSEKATIKEEEEEKKMKEVYNGNSGMYDSKL